MRRHTGTIGMRAIEGDMEMERESKRNKESGKWSIDWVIEIWLAVLDRRIVKKSQIEKNMCGKQRGRELEKFLFILLVTACQ